MTEPETSQESPEGATGDVALDQGTYEIVRERLLGQGRDLAERAEALNRARVELFGGAEMELRGSERIRTENNCVPRDIVPAGNLLLFGFNVFVGMRSEVRVDDVLSAHRFEPDGDGPALHPVPIAEVGFLNDPQFLRDFREVHQYYKSARVSQLRQVDGRVLAVFQIGDSAHDLKVFRWDTSGAEARYLDNRGERDHVYPRSHDFEWTPTSRDDHVAGRFPHVSIEDEVFVDTLGGSLTIKVENNTEEGAGIFREAVVDADQALEDAEVRYARVGQLLLLRILPYREAEWRYFVFNTQTRAVARIDAIGQACVELPEDHGIIFPGGYYLRNGEQKSFDGDVSGMEFLRRVRSPNGEDVLYVFYERSAGTHILLPYNTIRKTVQNPVHCHGYSLFPDGRMIVFRALDNEPSRVHTMQIWQTPFTSEEFAARAPAKGSFLETVGNPELVRAISDTLSLGRAIESSEPSRVVFEEIVATATRTIDHYHWLGSPEVGNLAEAVESVRATTELIIDEFEKVEALRVQAARAVAALSGELDKLLQEIRPDEWSAVDAFVAALAGLRRKRGEIITARDLRYVDRARLDGLEARVQEEFDGLSGSTVDYLLRDDALRPYRERIERGETEATAAAKVADLTPVMERLDAIGAEIEVLTEIVGGLAIDDATIRTAILEEISSVLSGLNRAKATARAHRKELATREGGAEFAAQFALFGQAVTSSLGMAGTPEQCDDQLSRLLVQLEDLEGRFSEFDEYLLQLATKREDVYEAFSSRKQTLLDERQRRAEHAFRAADRLLQGITRRAAALGEVDDLNAYFAADPMIQKVRDLALQLRGLEDSVRADELEARIKSARQDAGRALRDREDIFEDGASVIRLGRHRFSVNTQELDLTLVPREGEMSLHLTGTDFHERVADEGFQSTRPYWDQLLVSETPDVYRGEYLAHRVLRAAEAEERGLSITALQELAVDEEALLECVRRVAAEHYDEGYERGVHDVDAARILAALVSLRTGAGLLRFRPDARALAQLYWARTAESESRPLHERRAASLGRLRDHFASAEAVEAFVAELAGELTAFAEEHGLGFLAPLGAEAGGYLFEELVGPGHEFVLGEETRRLVEGFRAALDATDQRRALDDDLRALEGQLRSRYALVEAWLEGFLATTGEREGAEALHEAVVHLLTESELNRRPQPGEIRTEVDALLGQHPRIAGRSLPIRLDAFLSRLGRFERERVPGFRAFQSARHELLQRERERLRIDEFRPDVMSAFVRNHLIDEVYLPLIGANLAKQIGAQGDAKRTDLMGLLLLISPPGYGKTTLMEYVANRLGLVFVKVNGPALGHAVTSLDPGDAPNLAARQEVERINLAFEMGNNVLLYLDDIQHTSSELLQKFISLCDAQRKVEGVYKGRSRTYDLRGKRFCVCMAGNPYTESGETFQIPDMLANRADIYNLGDVLSGNEERFALSYIENALTSNPVLAPLASRDLDDVAKLVRMAGGEALPADALSHGYSAVELEEIGSVLGKLLRVQQVVMAVNGEYVRSASMDDAFRTEPSFKLQGSYRNLNKMAEKVVSVMNAEEVEALLDDHYQGEAQTLTTGAEQNLLKLALLRGTQTPADAERWEQILRDFRRLKHMGGAEDDPATRVVGQLSSLSDHLEGIAVALRSGVSGGEGSGDALRSALEPFVTRLDENLDALAQHGAESGGASDPMAGLAPAELAQHVGQLGQRLAEIGDAIVLAGSRQRGGEDAPASDLSAYLDRLDSTLQAFREAPRGGEVVQTLGAGVVDLIEKMLTSISHTMLPMLRTLEKRADLGRDDHRTQAQINRTLKNFDMLRDLLEALKKIDTREIIRRVREEG